MKLNQRAVSDAGEAIFKPLAFSLVPVAGCSLAAAYILSRVFAQPGRTVLEVMLLPVVAYVAGLGFVSLVYFKEWNRLRAADQAARQPEESPELDAKFRGVKAVYLTYQEEEANVYLMMGWLLLRVPVRQTDVDGQQPSYLLGWQSSEPVARPKFDSKTRKFVC